MIAPKPYEMNRDAQLYDRAQSAMSALAWLGAFGACALVASLWLRK